MLVKNHDYDEDMESAATAPSAANSGDPALLPILKDLRKQIARKAQPSSLL
jgi:hypothetical protein